MTTPDLAGLCERLPRRMSPILPFRVEGHDPDCAAHLLEPCDCVTGILRTVEMAFATQLRTALEGASDDR